jgi:murein DD-endopeptidase MepM/ murein hydrolase activator NlpD
MYDGVIYNTLYQAKGAGYWTQIQSFVNGEIIISQYYHLQKAGRTSGGTKVKAGDIIGYQGDSGNLADAIAKKYTVSHVHICLIQETIWAQNLAHMDL